MPDARSSARRRLLGLPLALSLALLAGPARAATRLYAFELPVGDSLAFEVPFEVVHEGRLIVRAEWTGKRIVSFRIEPDTGPVLRRSGPSPQQLELAVGAAGAGGPGRWTVAIHALPSAESARGLLTLELPEPAAPARDPARDPTPVLAPPPASAARLHPRDVPAASRPLLVGIERLRAQVLTAAGSPARDSCGWQQGFLRYLEAELDRATAGGAPGGDSAMLLARIAHFIGRIESLRVSKDPLLAGPPPSSYPEKRVWRQLRARPVEQLERGLDALMQASEDDRRPPELAQERWLPRLLACLTACERHFNGRAELGPAEAPNADLVQEQWEVLLAAAQALEALAGPAAVEAVARDAAESNLSAP